MLSKNRIFIAQTSFIENLCEIDDRTVENTRIQTELRSILGKLQCIATQTHPDISMRNRKDADVSLIKKANKIIRELKFEKNRSLILEKFEHDFSTSKLAVFSDASLGNNVDGTTQGGVLFCVENGVSIVPVSWQSRKLRVAHSTLCAESLALCDGIDCGIALRNQFVEFWGKQIPIFCYVDNKLLIDSINSLKTVTEKRLRIEIAYIREAVHNENVKVQFIPSERQLADCLTKHSKTSSAKMKKITGIGCLLKNQNWSCLIFMDFHDVTRHFNQ